MVGRPGVETAEAGVVNNTRPPASADVVVVGGGLAGLAAAVTLAEAGVDVQLLETRERVGGRVFTLRDPFDDGLFAEGGGEFISPGHEVMRQFVRRYGLAVRARPPRARALYFGGRLHSGETLGECGGRVRLDADRVERKSLELAVQIADPSRPWSAPDAAALDSQSVGAWLDEMRLDPLVRAYHQTWKTVDYGVEPERLSLLMHARDERLIQLTTSVPERPTECVVGGADQLPRAMAGGLGPRVHLATTATGLCQSEETVIVRYAQDGVTGLLESRYVVVALPFSVLRQRFQVPGSTKMDSKFQVPGSEDSGSRFQAPGSRRRNPEPRPLRTWNLEPGTVISGLRYGHILKVLLQFRRRFWRGAGVSGIFTDLPFRAAYDGSEGQASERGILTVYTAGVSAAELAALTEEERVASCLEQLELIFPGCRAWFERGISVVWAAEPASLGAYSHFGPGELSRFGPELACPHGRIHFAGEHTDPWQATMNGALASGVRASREVLARLEQV